MKQTLKLASLFVFALILLAACKQAGQKNTEVNSTEKLNEEEIAQSIEKVMFPLPEPMNVYQMLQNIGATYMGDVLNPVESLEQYFPNTVKSVNMGVYAADLSYATVYNKKEDIDSYSQALKVLIDDLGIKIDYKKLTSEETKEKATNADSLIKITSNVFFNTYEFLYNESDPALAALMVNGFYIEGLYIATHISKDTYDNVEMVEIIFNQAKPLEEIIELNSKFSDNQYVQTLQGALLKLKALYDETDGSLTKEQLEKITSAVETIRASLVS
jgi:hypothetical protein